MNQQQTIERMKNMRLLGMAHTHYTNVHDQLCQDYTIDQYITLLVDQEWEYRHNKKMSTLLKNARFRAPATIDNIDYTAHRGLDKNAFERLATLGFLAKNQNIIITGPTGIGKSYLAQAIGRKACIELHPTIYFSTARLIDDIQLARIQGTYHKLINNIQKAKLLILEDFGLLPFDQNGRQALMDIVEHKYDQSSLIITSQIPVANWHQLIGEGTIADAILDRIIHTSHRIVLHGESLRKNTKLTD
ncbi:MAG: putative insertion sequence ATP-binding protein y4pL [Saprospiraceae bacterium]|nr:MAG: putative insertion sequence ATP-binding protein y4pL [Saprospiraceae bacterium]